MALTAHGQTFETVEQALARVAEIDAVTAQFGESDGRVTERLLIMQAIDAATPTAPEPAPVPPRPAPARHTGEVTENLRTRTTHFVNPWGETFCGVEYRVPDDTPFLQLTGEHRATCRACCKAGDALARAGYPSNGGSAARRG